MCGEPSTDQSKLLKEKIIENSHGSKDKASQETALLSDQTTLMIFLQSIVISSG